MVEEPTGTALERIRNPAFRAYANMYDAIEREFRNAVISLGLEFAEEGESILEGALAERVGALRRQGARVENDGKSVWLNWISPACLACRKGVGTETFLISTRCPRNCYFCFNPNQADYDFYLAHTRDVAADLESRHDAGVAYTNLALTGGEPLLHVDEAVAFLERARTLYPDAHTRLYTSGAGLDSGVVGRLEAAGLSEIRFSVKLDEPSASVDDSIAKIEMCLGRIESVMVEMPVMPDQVRQMKELLVRLDEAGVQGINLLELCFPMRNAPEFARRGYKLKVRPYRVFYDYLYAGGLPISGSEAACVDLLEFAVDAGLDMGVQYCSLENKLTGQVYQQNRFIPAARPWHVMSERDFFLKSAKVFGGDIAAVEGALRERGEDRLSYDAEYDALEFPLAALPALAKFMPDLEVAMSVSIAERRGSENVVRELGVLKATPATFDPDADM